MTPDAAHNVVLGCGLTVAGVAVIDSARAGAAPPARRILGTGIATVALSALAGPAPDLASGLAILWAISTVLLSGAPAISAVTASVTAAARPASPPKPAAPATPPSAPPDTRTPIPGRPGTW